MDAGPLKIALAHANTFADSLGPIDQIDEVSSFNAADLRAIIAAADLATPEDRIEDKLGDLA